MELTDLNQYAFHGIVVGLVIVSALLVYVFGFKRPVEPPFDKLTNPHDERKVNGKKRKTKEKKPQSNGHVAGIGDSKKDVKKEVEKSPNKEKKSEKKTALKENSVIKPATTPIDTKKKSKGKENVEVKNKKAKAADEKPKDFDDGEWEQAPSRKDKKNKKNALEEILSPKKDKKKDQKKKKDESPDKDEVVAAPVAEPEPPVPEPEPPVQPEEPLPQRNEVVAAESDGEQVEEQAKPKRSRKKKGASGEQAASEEGKAEPVVAEPAKAAQNSPKQPAPKPKKEPAPQPPATPPAAPKVEPPAPVQAPAAAQPQESSVVFDELGDTWKEAKAPKKGGKKKSRKE